MLRIRLKRIFTIVFLLLVKNLILIFITAYSPAIQSFLATEATKFLSKKFEIDLAIEKLYLKIPNKIILNNVYLNDSLGNRLLETDKINISIAAIKILRGELHVEEVNIENPFIDVMVDTSGVANYKYIFNKFSSDKEKDDSSSSGGFDIYCNKFSIVDAHFKYHDERKKHRDGIFDFTNMDISGINLTVNDFKYYSDTIDLKILDFSLNEQSGLDLKKLSLDFKFFNTGIIVKNLIFETNYSKIRSPIIELRGNDPDYLSDPIKKLTARANIDTIIFDIADLIPFIPEYRGLHDKVHLSGDFSGKLSNIKIKDFSVAYRNDTRLLANFSVDGLPDYDLAFIFGNISKLETSEEDIARILKLVSPKKPVTIPKIVNELEHISFTGNITGLLNDLVAYGQFDTGLGALRTDLAIATDFEKKKVSASGKLRATDVQLGKITGNTETFGLLSLNSSLNGQIDSLGNFNVKMDCDVSSLGLLDYNYTGIKVIGLLSNKNFDGELYIDDPNLQVEFLGKYRYDVENTENELDFSSDIWANLSNLNLMNDSLNCEVKFVLSSDLHGDFDNIPQGNVHLSELKFNYKEEVIKLYQLNLNSYIDEQKQQYLTLRSDYCDINLFGELKFNELKNIFTNMAHNYVSAFVDSVEYIPLTSSNSANFDIRFKNINTLSEIFVPKLNVKNDLFIEGMIAGQENMLDLVVSIPVVSYDSIYVWGSELHLTGYKDSLDLKFVTQEISTGAFPLFENLNIDFDVANNSSLFALNWDNYDTSRNSGNIKIGTNFIKNSDYPIPKIENTIYSSEVTTQNRVWNIAESSIDIDPNNMGVAVEGFSVNYENQSITLSGEVSQDKLKLLRFAINNVDISNINSYISNSGYQINGILTGNGRIADVYNNPIFRASLSINNFKVNNEDFGRFDISAMWDGGTNGFNVEGNNRYLKLRGIYTPESDAIDVNLLVDNFKLEVLEPYLNDYDLSDLRGAVNINLIINGKASNPNISGYIDFDKAELTYDYLKLRALLDDRLEITKTAILFKDFRITDEYNHAGVINGGLYHNNFRDIRFDFLINTQNMKLLNTTEKDNSSYYGTAYATAEARIAGNGKKFGIDVVAKTEPNTIFVLPMTSTYEAGGVSYLTFINPSADSSETIIVQPIKSGTDFYFKMDIEVTPDAEVQIVFDPKVGDVIKGNAKGNLKMEYTTDQEFFMYGEAEIVEGDYLFTLENIINKKLIVTPGGTITWSGDPVDANLDLYAVYQTRAPLKELMAEVGDSSEMKRSANVECKMHMTGKLTSPDIKFSIEVPSGSDKVKAQLANMSQDETNKQFIFLLVMNRFYATNQSGIGTDMGNTTNPLGSTSLELITNQVNNWLSQISKDFDIGFKYHPGSEVSGQELEVAMSTQILNDRVLINGNVGYGDDINNPSSTAMIGDIEVQLKVNPSGTFRLRGFSRINNGIETEYGPYTSGAGIFYTKDFNTFGELMRDMWKTITFQNMRDKRKAKKQKNK